MTSKIALAATTTVGLMMGAAFAGSERAASTASASRSRVAEHRHTFLKSVGVLATLLRRRKRQGGGNGNWKGLQETPLWYLVRRVGEIKS